MRRFIVDMPISGIPSESYDVVIAGGGLSGLYTSLLIDPKLKVAVLAKADLLTANSSLAQGGIAAAVSADDNPEIHYKDTRRAAAGMGDDEATRLLVEKGPAAIQKLAALGVAFDMDANGNWLTTSEGAHRKNRILHCGGDATGKLIMEQMIERVRSRSNIQVFEYHFLTDILTDSENKVAGVVAWSNDFKVFKASRVVIATGGIGGIYRYTTNQSISTGDGIGAAIRAAARVSNMEFVQFHPTAFFNPDQQGSLFLISEAVRGEGAILRNNKGDAFMSWRHKLKDLAPRDIVSLEIFREMTESGTDHVYLDIRNKERAWLKKRFPTIYSHLALHGVKMEKDLIPVVPAQHYFMGGIKTNLWGQTSVRGLYACGEAANTGVHGANRLASNSLLECVVFGAQVAESVQNCCLQPTNIVEGINFPLLIPVGDIAELKKSVQQMMQNYGGIARNPQGLVRAIDYLSQVQATLKISKLGTRDSFELLNMVQVGREILLAALTRRESVGSHFLQEEPEESLFPQW